MKKLVPSLFVLLATFIVGVGLSMYLRHWHGRSNKPWNATPCREGLASVDNDPEPTLKITLLETSCEKQVARVHFAVSNVGMTPIKYYQVRAIYTYDNHVDDGAEFGTGPLVTGQSNDGYIGQGPPRFGNGKLVGQLRGITLIPSLLEFEDGRKWRRPSIHEQTSK